MRFNFPLIVATLGTLSITVTGCRFATSMIVDEAARPGPTRRIESAPPTNNPVIAGNVPRTVEGQAVLEPAAVTIHGQQFGVAMTRYRNDALCLTFMTERESSRASASRFDPDLQHNYQLVAPTDMIDPKRAPFVEANSVKPTAFSGTYDHTNLAVKEDAVVLNDRYRVGETWDVCFDRVSRVLTPRSRYALVRFVDNEGQVQFAYAWRFGDPHS